MPHALGDDILHGEADMSAVEPVLQHALDQWALVLFLAVHGKALHPSRGVLDVAANKLPSCYKYSRLKRLKVDELTSAIVLSELQIRRHVSLGSWHTMFQAQVGIKLRCSTNLSIKAIYRLEYFNVQQCP